MAYLKDIVGVNIIAPFKPLSKTPIDAREIVDTFEERDELATIGVANDGLIVFVRENKTAYTWNGTEWIENTQGHAYSHPVGDGNLHVPATGTTSNGKFLKAGPTAGDISWQVLKVADITDFPDSIKNPYPLTFSGYDTQSYDGSVAVTVPIPTKLPTPKTVVVTFIGGTTEDKDKFTFDGSVAKTINITPAAIGLGNVNNTPDSEKHVALADRATDADNADNASKTTGTLSFTNGSTVKFNGSTNQTVEIPTKLPTPKTVVVTFIGGTTEDKDKFTFDGSVAKTINITPAAIGLGNVNNTPDSEKHVASADKLFTGRTISVSNDVTGSVVFDGTKNVDIVATLKESGVTAGSYGTATATTLGFSQSFNVPYVTVDSKGRVTSIANKAVTLPPTPTTITGNAGSATKLQTPRTISISSDATGSVVFDGTEDVDIPITLRDSGAKAGAYGTGTATSVGFGKSFNIPYTTVDAKGRVTAISNIAITLPPTPTTITGNAGSATKLETARTISVSNDVTGSVSFDGTKDVDIVATLKDSGAKAGSYGTGTATTLAFSKSFNVPYVTVDAKGRVTSISSIALTMPPTPTTITGNAGSATKLLNARTISVSNDVTGSASFDGTKNIDIVATLKDSGAKAGSYGTSANASPNFSGSFTVPYVTVDAKGRVTSISNVTVTLPANPNTHYASKTIIGASATAVANAATDNTKTFLNHVENNVVTSSHQIKGAGATTVAADATGILTITSTNTTYAAGTGLTLSSTTFNHKNSVTAKTAAAQAAKTLTWGGSFNVYEDTYDAQGHVTGTKAVAITMPANPNTNTTYTLSGALSGNTFVNTLTPSSGSATTATVPAFAAGKAGLVPAAGTADQGKFLRGDATWQAFPTTLKNPTALNIQFNGTLNASYDGSAAKTVNITPAAINALNKTGDTATGLITFSKGTSVNPPAGGTAGTAGYVQLAEIKVTAAYANRPVTFILASRGRATRCAVSLMFSNNASTDPPISSFTYEGTDYNVNIYKSATSTWHLYVQKSEGYDAIEVIGFSNPRDNGITVTWTNVHATTPPSGSTKATPLASSGNAATATKVGHTLSFSGGSTAKFDGSADVSVAIPTTLKSPYALTIQGNSKTIDSYDGSVAKTINITPANIGAATSGHTHSYAGSASVGGPATSLAGFKTTSTTNLGVSATDVNNAIGYISGLTGMLATDGALYRQTYSATWIHQIFGDYRTGQIQVRGMNNGTWGAWRTVIDTSNFKTHITPSAIGAAASSHTHPYAGAAAAGGSANSAVKLDTSAGSATQPVYFSGGKPTACTYTLSKSVPADAVFTDTKYTLSSFGITATAAELNYCDGVTSNIQTQLNAKAASSHTHAYLPLTGGTLTGRIQLPTVGGGWISGMTLSNASIGITTTNSSGSYHPVIAGKTYNGHFWNLGTYIDTVGFYGFKSGRTANGTDWSFTINVATGAVSSTGNITAPTFVGALSGNATTATTATTATKLSTASVGSATQPVYFSGGVPVACTYTLGKSVPSNALFTDTNTWIAFKGASSSAAGTAGYVPAPTAGQQNLFFRGDGTWAAVSSSDTKNTAGSTDTSSKIFLIGATSQASSAQTYSQDTAYVGTDGCVYSGGKKTSVEGHTHTKSQITDFPTIPTVNNATLTINQGGVSKGTFTANASANVTINLTDTNTTYTAGTGLSLSGTAFSVYNQNLDGSGTNLNNNTTHGFYHQAGNAGASAGSNYPVAKAGMLTVLNNGSYKYQIYNTYDGANMYFRAYYQSWSTWKRIANFDDISWTNLSGKPTIPTVPASLKNPYALTIQGNGSAIDSYDGSAAKTINITAAKIGAAASSHSHSNYSSSAAGFVPAYSGGFTTATPTGDATWKVLLPESLVNFSKAANGSWSREIKQGLTFIDIAAVGAITIAFTVSGTSKTLMSNVSYAVTSLISIKISTYVHSGSTTMLISATAPDGIYYDTYTVSGSSTNKITISGAGTANGVYMGHAQG